MHNDEFIELIEDVPQQTGKAEHCSMPPWKVLIVDDDVDVHESTTFALQGLTIEGRTLQLLHASSSEEALRLLVREDNIAVILLDVVMETDDSGLRAVDAIRNDLNLRNIRIILRTGQPGHAPEIETIQRYDINDYKTKSELTRTKLYTTLTTAIRAYHQLSRMDANRRGLEQIIEASNQLIAERGLTSFAEGIIMQIASLIDIRPEGLVCASKGHASSDNDPQQLKIIAAAGCYRHLIQHPLADIGNERIIADLTRCLNERRNLIGDHSLSFYFSGRDEAGYAAFVDSPQLLDEIDRHLLQVFCTNIALCAQNVQLVDRLHDLAFVDTMLGLPNRTAFVQQLSARLGDRRHGASAVALIDIDHFAETNDMFGHAYGDLLLAAIAARLREHLNTGHTIARVAGDTFALLGDRRQINPERLIALFTPPFTIEGVARPVSVSMGFAPISDETDGQEVLKNASIALKRAKSKGQGLAETYTPAIGQETKEHMGLLQGIYHAFADQRFFLVYQPQINLFTNEVTGLEALLRWRTADGALVPPGRFIPVAERSGLIVTLGEWVLRSALEAWKVIRDAGYADLRMAVNVSLVQCKHPAMLDMLDHILVDSNADPAHLELEITESVAIMGMTQVVSLLKAIKERHIDVAIDDFGTGFSSLSYLDRLPVDRLKIDRSFVAPLDDSRTGARIAEMIVSLGHTLGITVLAEGVEDPEQAVILKNIGCNEAQGYLYAKPMPLNELLVWLANWQGGRP